LLLICWSFVFDLLLLSTLPKIIFSALEFIRLDPLELLRCQ